MKIKLSKFFPKFLGFLGSIYIHVPVPVISARGHAHPCPAPSIVSWFRLDVAHTTFHDSAHTKTHRHSIRLRRLFILTHYSDSECLQTNTSLLPAAFLAWPAELQTLPFPQQTRWKRREIQYNLGKTNTHKSCWTTNSFIEQKCQTCQKQYLAWRNTFSWRRSRKWDGLGMGPTVPSPMVGVHYLDM